MTRSPRRVRPLHPRRLVAVACAVVVVALVLALPAAHAGFSAVTDNPGDAWATDQLSPPSALVATQTCTPPPTIAFRSATTASGSGSITLPVPAGTVAGDLLLAQLAYGYTTTAPTAPAGWTLVRADTPGTSLVSAVYRRTAGAGESSATFAFPAPSTIAMAGGVAAYSGVSATTPVDAAAGVTGFGSVATTPAVTTTTAGTVLVRFIANGSEAYPAPVGTSQRWRFAPASGGGISAGDEPFPGPGTAASRNSSSPSGTSAYGVGQTVALRRAPGTPSATLTWTPSTSAWATGYRLERSTGGTVQTTRTVTPVGTASTTEGPLANGVPYAFRLWSHRGTWVSTAVTTTLTPSC